MLSVSEIIVVEGKYDKIRLSQIVDAVIVTTDGFRIYKNREKLELLKRMAEQKGIIILTDSDSAGFRIRNHIIKCLGDVNVKNAYVPEVKGKEKRKSKIGSEGILGVEGIDDQIILEALQRARATQKRSTDGITKADFFKDGLSGGAGSAEKRRMLAKKMGLPPRMSAKALIDVINTLYTAEEYRSFLE